MKKTNIYPQSWSLNIYLQEVKNQVFSLSKSIPCYVIVNRHSDTEILRADGCHFLSFLDVAYGILLLSFVT